MTIEEKKLLFLQDYCQGVVQNKTKSWADYAEKYQEHKDRVRKWWRSFVAIHQPKGNWFEGELITPDWTSTINQALAQGVATRRHTFKENGDMEVPLPYDGLKPRKVWEGQVKGGGTRLLHSYEFDQEKERFEAFEEKMTTLFRTSLNDVVPYIPSTLKANDMLLNVLTADKHLGSWTKEAIFGNEYSEWEFERRLDLILPAIQDLVVKFGVFDQINIVDLGDSVDGVDNQTTRKGHKLDQNLDNIGQYEAYVRIHKLFFDKLVLAGFANKIKFIAATNDNHSGFFTYITVRAVEEYLNAKYPNIETRVEKKFIFHDGYGIHKFIYSHGKDAHVRRFGLPLKLDKSAEDIINDYIGFHKLDKDIPYELQRQAIHFIKGDLHQTAEEFGKRFRYRNIMSMYGASNYIQLNYGNQYKGFELEIHPKNIAEVFTVKKFIQDDPNFVQAK